MENKDFKIGHHFGISYGLKSVITYAKSKGANFFQIFLASPRVYTRKKRTDEELTNFKKALKDNNMTMVVHANYMLNFCNPVDTLKHAKAKELLVADLNDSVKIGDRCLGVVIHMGKSLDMAEETAIRNYVKGVQSSLKEADEKSRVILETGAGQGTEVCTSINGLGKLYKKFKPKYQKRLSFCIDTCHVFAAGYDLSNTQYVDIFKDYVDINLGWDKISVIHLNDSKCPVNSRKDRHQDIGKGYIGKQGLKKFVKICWEKGVPVVLETPCDEISKDEQIKMVKKFIE